jgi:hypothetical protein
MRHPQKTDQNLHDVDKCRISKKVGLYLPGGNRKLENERKRNHDKYKAIPERSCVGDESWNIRQRFSVICASLH